MSTEITNLHLNDTLVDLEGNDIKEGEHKLTFRQILIRLLSTQTQGLTAAVKRQRYDLALLLSNKTVEVIGVAENDLLMLKKLAEVLPTMLMGMVQDYLNGIKDGKLVDPARLHLLAQDVEGDEAPPPPEPPAEESAAEACQDLGT